jgi:hypothetical protein
MKYFRLNSIQMLLPDIFNKYFLCGLATLRDHNISLKENHLERIIHFI